MSPRKAILQELTQAHQNGVEGTRPSSIRGFSENSSKYQSAVNELLKAQLINGQKDSEGLMAISLNPLRVGEVHKELRPIFARPGIWAGLMVVAAGASYAFLF